MIDLTDLDGRMVGHAERIARADRRGWLRPWLATGTGTDVGERPSTVQNLRRRGAVALVRAGAWLLGAQAGSRLGTGRVVRQPAPAGTSAAGFGSDRPVALGFGPDGALYLSFPAVGSVSDERPGVLVRIDLAG